MEVLVLWSRAAIFGDRNMEFLSRIMIKLSV